MEPLLIVSADSHGAASMETIAEYWDPGFDDLTERLQREDEAFAEGRGPLYFGVDLDAVDDRGAIARQGYLGAWDVKTRLAELDQEGVAGELIVCGHQLATMPLFGQMNSPQPPEYRWAGVRAHHRWLADQMAEGDGRLYGIGDPGPALDLDALVAEIHWMADHRFRSISIPGIIGDPEHLPPLFDDYYEPFWKACADVDFVLNVHAGWGLRQGRMDDFRAAFRLQFGMTREDMASEQAQRLLAEQLRTSPDSPLRLTIAPRRAFWQLLMGGVFDRYPNLKLVLSEVRADWLPATLAHLDQRFEAGDFELAKRPSEYWATNGAITPSSPHVAEIELRDEIGIDGFLFGSDYPHPEGTWPNTRDWIRYAFQGVSETDARKILGESAIRVYGLDREHLATVAARVGPDPADLLVANPDVPEARLAAFDQRAGFRREAEVVNPYSLDVTIDEDRAAFAR